MTLIRQWRMWHTSWLSVSVSLLSSGSVGYWWTRSFQVGTYLGTEGAKLAYPSGSDANEPSRSSQRVAFGFNI